MRIFIGEADRWDGKRLDGAIVQEAKRRGLAGATVWKGFMGCGAQNRMHTAKILRLSEDLPMLIEIVDTVKRSKHFCPILIAWSGKGS